MTQRLTIREAVRRGRYAEMVLVSIVALAGAALLASYVAGVIHEQVARTVSVLAP